jgi:tetratricopeptide (TPR) repeat protein
MGLKMRHKRAWFFLFFSLSCASIFCASAEEYFNTGTKAYLDGRYSDAIKYLNAAIKLDIRNPKYYTAVGDCYKQTGQIEKAMLYYDYADKLGGVPQDDYNATREKENLKRANLIAVNPSVMFAGIINLYYERRITDRISAGIDTGYMWSSLLMGFIGSGSDASGFGDMFGTRLNFFFEGKALSGLFAGPELYYYSLNADVVTIDEFGDRTSSKFQAGIVTAGAHLGYRYIFDGGLSADVMLGVNYIKCNSGSFNISLVLPTLGANIGYAF